MSPQSNNSLDVTLARKDCHIGTSQPVCKFNQTGFCKFGENCTNMHVNKLCNTLNCNKHICNNRHPKQCKYFLVSGKCRFNNDCAFAHKKSGTNIKVEELEMEVIQLKLEVESLKSNVLRGENELLRKSLEELKVIVVSNSQIIESLQNKSKVCEDQFKCEICGYKASSTTILKSHMTKKHKHETLREDHHELSCSMSPVNEQRSEAYKDSTELVIEPVLQPAEQQMSVKFKCEKCSDGFGDCVTLEEHMIKNHIEPEAKTECWNCGEEFKGDVLFHAYRVCWSKGIVGSSGWVVATCYVCYKEFLEFEASERCAEFGSSLQ